MHITEDPTGDESLELQQVKRQARLLRRQLEGTLYRISQITATAGRSTLEAELGDAAGELQEFFDASRTLLLTLDPDAIIEPL